MKNKLKCVLLIDDELSTNYIHKRIINKLDICDEIIIQTNAFDALNFLNYHENIVPDLIFLDINMPGMDGWEFLEEYDKIEASRRASQVLVMLSTSMNPDDKTKALNNISVKEFLSKPLNTEVLQAILEKNFK